MEVAHTIVVFDSEEEARGEVVDVRWFGLPASGAGQFLEEWFLAIMRSDVL